MNQATKMPEYLYALTVRLDQDGTIPVERRDGVTIRDPFSRIRNVAVGYNTGLSRDFRHAGQITRAARQDQELHLAWQLDQLWAQTPKARLGILDFAEALLPSAADARASQPVQWQQFVAMAPPALDTADLDAEYEARVRDHLTGMVRFCQCTWRIPWAFPTFPGSRYFALAGGGYTEFVGYPLPGEPEYERHPLQTENDRALLPILDRAGAILVQAGYFDAVWEPGFENPHWAPGMWDQGRLRRADVERKIRSELGEAMRLAAKLDYSPAPQVYAMACPVVRRKGDPWVNRETWALFTGICAGLGIPIVLWMAFASRDQVVRFQAWCKEVGVPLPGEIWLPEPAGNTTANASDLEMDAHG